MTCVRDAPCVAAQQNHIGMATCPDEQHATRPCYLFPLARLWVLHSIWQFLAVLSPPLLHAETWSASIKSNTRTASSFFSVEPPSGRQVYDSQIVATRARSGVINFANVSSGCGSTYLPVSADSVGDNRKQAPS